MRTKSVALTAAASAAALLAAAGADAQTREQIRIVGSSTVYPFATTVAERFGERARALAHRQHQLAVLGALAEIRLEALVLALGLRVVGGGLRGCAHRDTSSPPFPGTPI